MIRSCVVCSFVLSLFVTSFGRAHADSGAINHRRPNILLIFSDDQGYHDVGCYGSEIATPNIDSIARDGIKLEQFYAASSICTPSRFGLLTGRFAQRSQDQLTGALMFLSEEDAGRGIRFGETTFVSRLQAEGYDTHLVGKWHLGHGDQKFWPTEHGFDSFFGHTGGCVDFFTCRYGNRPDWYRGSRLVETKKYATEEITDEVLELIREKADRAAAETPTPWYLHVAYNAPHFGKAWSEEKGAPENVMQPDAKDLAHVVEINDPLRRAFAAKVVGMDRGIGKILETLRDTGFQQNTLVIFMTDHGGDPKYGGSNVPYRGGKATLFEGGIRVPCVMRWPGVITPGTTSDAMATAYDLYPTIAEVVGLPTEQAALDGISILPLLKGQSQRAHPAVVWATGSHAELNRQQWHAVRDGDWKLVDPPGESAMLFNVRDDAEETTDLAEKHPEKVKRLGAMIQRGSS